MNTLDLINAKRNSFTVPELRKMLGIRKTDSYWILKHRQIETVIINGQIRILKSSFDEWYANQIKYHIIGGPEPGENLKSNSYSPRDMAVLLDISENITYTLISRGHFETFTVDYEIRVTKESFERWYASQDKYRLENDRQRDLPLLAISYSMPDIRRLLGVHRNTVYYIMEHYENAFDVMTVAGQKRITIESFNHWYASQSRYKMQEDTSILKTPDKLDFSVEIEENKDTGIEATAQSEASAEKEVYRLEELMSLLNISRKTAYRLIQSGELLAVKAGKAYLIPAFEYQRYIGRSKNDGLDYSEE